ncbi:MAG: tRNA-dihydrouridine synthase family protein [Parasporobacterium sp.]|nr:tRNA-dihydrouridine synthase family protein [Parasporobacterium sp.]
MQFYLAPLEGVTGHVFREAYERYFHDVDKYFTPFLSANDHLNPKTKRELQSDLSVPLIPQILGNQAEKILDLMEEIAAEGDFDEINLNFGCPSGTVTAKGRGAGIFKDLIAMDDLLDNLFAKSRAKISLKTRIGYSDPAEWEQIVRIYADYPFSEIIIHPRVRTDQYRLPCRPEAFAYAREHLKMPLCYNGEINSAEDLDRLCSLFPGLDRVMIGRGVVRNPFLISDLRKHLQGQKQRQGKETDKDTRTAFRTDEERSVRREFVKALEEGYLEQMQQEKHAVMRMKEFWLYFGTSFPQYHQALKAVKKAKTLSEYKVAVSAIPL